MSCSCGAVLSGLESTELPALVPRGGKGPPPRCAQALLPCWLGQGVEAHPQEPHLQTPQVPKSSCQSPWPHVARRTSHGNGPPMPRHSGVFKNQNQEFYQQLGGFGFCPSSRQHQAKLLGLE